MFRKILISLLLTWLPLFGMNLCPSTNNDTIYKDQRNNFSNFQFEDSTDFKTNCENSESSFECEEYTYKFKTTYEAIDVSVVGDASLLKYSIAGHFITCQIGSFLFEEGGFTICFTNENGNFIDRYTIYYSRASNNTIFSSSLSLDVARRNAGKKLSYHFEDEKKNPPNTLGYSAISNGIGVTGSVSGLLKFAYDNLEHPLVGAKVKVTISGSWWSEETYTDDDGHFSISYKDIWYVGSGKPSVHIYASGKDVSVKYTDIYMLSHEFDGSSGNLVYDRTFSSANDGDLGKAMNIFQAAQQYAAFSKTLPNSDAISHCYLSYPGNPNYGCYYSPGNKTITITSKQREDSSLPESYYSWDVIGHEYGHHIQSCMGFSANVGGNHSSSQNDIDRNVSDDGIVTSEIKSKGLRLAWNESWPTYFSIMAQKCFHADFKDSVYTVNDTYYTSYNGLNYDLDPLTYPIDCARGDGCERAIMRFLYKLSSPTVDNYDRFSLSFETIWKITCESKATTLYDFVNALYKYGLNRYDLGRLLSVFNITIDNIKITNNYLDRCPTFTWSTYMGSDYLRYNEFDLIFVNVVGGPEILRKSNIFSSSNNASYTLTREEWAAVIAANSKIYFVYVVSRQTDFFTSGNYCSELFMFKEPDDFADKIQIKPNEWGFEPQYFFTTNKGKQTSTPINEKGLTITHDRLRCGYIEDSYVVLSPRRENAGLAYLTMQFDRPVYSYMFGVALWSNSEWLNPSDSTAIVETMDRNGTWHEDMNFMVDLPNGFSIKTQQIDRFEIAHDDGIYGLRFVLTSSAVGSRNKGRLCLDDLVLNTDSNDLWFISRFYE